ncbi:MAG: hypothetical protein Q9172_001062 [Xanthocarpia lactea]
MERPTKIIKEKGIDEQKRAYITAFSMLKKFHPPHSPPGSIFQPSSKECVSTPLAHTCAPIATLKKGLNEVKGDPGVQSFFGGSEWLSYAPKLVSASDEDARQGSLLDIMLWSQI